MDRCRTLTLDRGGFLELSKGGYEETEELVRGQVVAEQRTHKLTGRVGL